MAVSPGDPAPSFELPDHEGSSWSLSEHRGKPVLLIFHRHLG